MPTCHATLTRDSSTTHVSPSHYDYEGVSAEYRAGCTRPHAAVTEPLHTILLCGHAGLGAQGAPWAGWVDRFGVDDRLLDPLV
jgi:hypothetical protein